MNEKPDSKSHKRLTILLVCGVFFMFGFCYMLVPLYNIVCKRLAINGKSVTSPSQLIPGMQIDNNRTIKVAFTTTVHSDLKFKFQPLVQYVRIHPGETKLVYFFAENQTGKPITVQAIPSITPADGAQFLKKTECFCFTQQKFFKGEKADMPVYFFIDPAVPKEIKEITLSYTLFDQTGIKAKKIPVEYTTRRIEL